VPLSVVIPAKNEARNIQRTLSAARTACRDASLTAQLVVVDNCSTDDTVVLAEAMADTVITVPAGSVGALRNAGVRVSGGEYVLFLDADVELTPQWSQNIHRVLQHMASEDCIAGAFVVPPASPRNALSSWFEYLNDGKKNYLGSAHMIVRKDHYERLGGFDESLVSGEDSDLCRRARLLGLDIVNDRGLLAVHHGYPATIRAFFVREWWHGSGDRGWSTVKGLSAVFGLLHVAILSFLLLGYAKLAAGCAVLVGLLCITASTRKFARQSVRTKLKNAFVFYIYFWGRVFSIVRPRSRTTHRAV
jgi:glycosyltransferase involved in cell wall biosynthesis